MRAFVAVAPPRAAVEDLTAFLEPRMDADTVWRWTPAENYHVTLAFLGEVDDLHLDRLIDALADVAARSGPLELQLRGAGAFSSVAAAKHLYQAVATLSGDLGALAERVRTAASVAGCPVDKDRFTPHVTVARARERHDATHVWRALDTYVGPAWPAREFALYRSDLGDGRNGHPRYTPYETFPLTGD